MRVIKTNKIWLNISIDFKALLKENENEIKQLLETIEKRYEESINIVIKY